VTQTITTTITTLSSSMIF